MLSECDRDGVGVVGCSEAAPYLFRVRLDGFGADHQVLRDLMGTQTFRDKLEDLALAGSEVSLHRGARSTCIRAARSARGRYGARP